MPMQDSSATSEIGQRHLFVLVLFSLLCSPSNTDAGVGARNAASDIVEVMRHRPDFQAAFDMDEAKGEETVWDTRREQTKPYVSSTTSFPAKVMRSQLVANSDDRDEPWTRDLSTWIDDQSNIESPSMLTADAEAASYGLYV